jgi:hypothetical protein
MSDETYRPDRAPVIDSARKTMEFHATVWQQGGGPWAIQFEF